MNQEAQIKMIEMRSAKVTWDTPTGQLQGRVHTCTFWIGRNFPQGREICTLFVAGNSLHYINRVNLGPIISKAEIKCV